jgi:hypothetical protein
MTNLLQGESLRGRGVVDQTRVPTLSSEDAHIDLIYLPSAHNTDRENTSANVTKGTIPWHWPLLANLQQTMDYSWPPATPKRKTLDRQHSNDHTKDAAATTRITCPITWW